MSVMPVQSASATSKRGTLGAGQKPSEARPSGSLLQRPTEASVAHSVTSGVLGKGRGKPRKELTFKQQLLKKTLKDSALRPCGVMALHIKHGHFHDIDSGGMFNVLSKIGPGVFHADLPSDRSSQKFLRQKPTGWTERSTGHFQLFPVCEMLHGNNKVQYVVVPS